MLRHTLFALLSHTVAHCLHCHSLQSLLDVVVFAFDHMHEGEVVHATFNLNHLADCFMC